MVRASRSRPYRGKWGYINQNGQYIGSHQIKSVASYTFRAELSYMVNRAQDYRAAAENVVSLMHDGLGVELKYDEQSIEWLDGYINRIRSQLDKEAIPDLAAALGAYVGETIIRTYGGAWAYFDQTEQWGVRFDNGDGAFPISKVYKQLEGGEFESVLSFYTIIPKLRTHLKTQTPSQ